MKYSQYNQATLLKTYGASAAAVRKNLVQITFDLGANTIKMYVHKKAVKAYEGACADYRSKVKAKKAKAYTFKAAYCGSFNWRNIKRANGTTSPNLSMHSFGIAVDFNSWNPNGQGRTAKSDIPAELVKSMNKFGIYWGGDWSGSTRDPMHFEMLPDGIQEPTSAKPTTPAKKSMPTIKRGSKGANVKTWQKVLGYTGGKVDGIFGAKTEAATKKWQKKKGLVADGCVGSKTWAKAGY